MRSIQLALVGFMLAMAWGCGQPSVDPTETFEVDIVALDSLRNLVYDSVVPDYRIDYSDPYCIVLGIAQDAGYPQINCDEACCLAYWEGDEEPRYVASMAIVDPATKRFWLIDATPDIGPQLNLLQGWTGFSDMVPEAIFLTHAHIGHYTGLMQLGREALGAQNIPVYCMPRMRDFLANNGPWDQLVQLNNIELHSMAADSAIAITESISLLPLLVPHRDEYSETVGFLIHGSWQQVLYISDIDKWDRWERKVEQLIDVVDVAFVDGTFYNSAEIPGRDMSEIPHPFISESMNRFQRLSPENRNKVNFIHFNHTNPVFRPTSERNSVINQGYDLAEEGDWIGL